MQEQPKISFCITCKGRLHHLKETLPQNLNNAADYPNVEFVVLDYDSQDGLGDWIKQNYQAEMDSGKIRYARVENKPHFHMAHAKNMAHRAATGDILCGLDADNTIAHGFSTWLAREFQKNPNIIVRPHKFNMLPVVIKKRSIHATRGLGGRIAILRENFDKLHGYDETYSGWGNDDGNFLSRALAHGLKHIRIPTKMVGDVIDHSDADRMANYDETAKENSQSALSAKKGLIGLFSHLRNPSGINSSPAKANPDGSFGCGTVTVNFKDEVTFPSANETQAVSEEIAGEVSNSDEHRRRHARSVTVSKDSSRARI